MNLFCIIVFFSNFLISNTRRISGVSSNYTDQINFVLYEGPFALDHVRVKFDDGLRIDRYNFFDPKRMTDMYFPGWAANMDSPSVTEMINAFLERNTSNFIVVDYSNLVKGKYISNYPRALENGSHIGTALGHFLKRYIPKLQHNNKVHLIGHGMGAHIMAKAAQVFGKGKLKWLTGLDPSKSLYDLRGMSRLTWRDAVFVDIIHTDSDGNGMPGSFGTVDFYPNLGHAVQPACVNQQVSVRSSCSHNMAYVYYAESVVNETAFVAKRCKWNEYCFYDIKFCHCERYNHVTYMGYAVSHDAFGEYFLKTNNATPYALGLLGVSL